MSDASFRTGRILVLSDHTGRYVSQDGGLIVGAEDGVAVDCLLIIRAPLSGIGGK